jgi:large repetitive protein
MNRVHSINKTSAPGKLRLTRRRKATVAAAAAIVVTTPVMASAVIDPFPAQPLEVVVFPERDFVVTEGGPANLAVNFAIIRNGVTIGTASGTTDADGLLEVNHPGGVCWQGVTPNIRPGDVLRVTEQANPANGYEVRTQGVRAPQAEIVGNNVVVHGVALDDKGDPLPLARVEQRIVQPEFREPPEPLEKRDIRATTDDGNLVRDNSPGASPGAFIATHSGLSAVQRQKAIEGQTRVLGWQRTAANGDRLGITIFEAGEVGGPGFGGCPLGQDYAVTSFSRPSVKVGTKGLTVAGTANDATAVRVTLVDGAAGTPDPSRLATLSAGAPKTFRASFTTRQLRKLRDGRIRAVGSYTVGGTAISGGVKSIVKDLRAPKPAQSDTRSGAYRGAQSVALFRAAGEPRTSRIFYTTNGRTPGLGSLRFRRPIRITSTKTLRAVVIDQAGNKSVSNCRKHVGCWRIGIR